MKLRSTIDIRDEGDTTELQITQIHIILSTRAHQNHKEERSEGSDGVHEVIHDVGPPFEGNGLEDRDERSHEVVEIDVSEINLLCRSGRLEVCVKTSFV